jgi:hypothetical protein
MHLYELALAEGETSRDLMVRARQIGLGTITATTVMTDEQIRRLCPQRAHRAAAAATTAAGEGKGEAPVTRPGPSMVAVAVSLVVALAVIASGVALLGGGPDRPTEAQAASVRRDADEGDEEPAAEADAEAEAEADVPPPPADLHLVVADVRALCAGWPPVAEFWSSLGLEVATAPDPEQLAAWAAERSRGIEMGLRDELSRAFDQTGSAAVLAVLDWLYDIAFPSDPLSLAEVREATDAVAPYVGALRQAAGESC